MVQDVYLDGYYPGGGRAQSMWGGAGAGAGAGAGGWAGNRYGSRTGMGMHDPYSSALASYSPSRMMMERPRMSSRRGRYGMPTRRRGYPCYNDSFDDFDDDDEEYYCGGMGMGMGMGYGCDYEDMFPQRRYRRRYAGLPPLTPYLYNRGAIY